MPLPLTLWLLAYAVLIVPRVTIRTLHERAQVSQRRAQGGEDGAVHTHCGAISGERNHG